MLSNCKKLCTCSVWRKVPKIQSKILKKKEWDNKRRMYAILAYKTQENVHQLGISSFRAMRLPRQAIHTAEPFKVSASNNYS